MTTLIMDGEQNLEATPTKYKKIMKRDGEDLVETQLKKFKKILKEKEADKENNDQIQMSKLF